MTLKRLDEYKNKLEDEELSKNTISKYLREAKRLEKYLEDKPENKKTLINYLNYLKNKGYTDSTINNKIISINKYIKFIFDDPENKKGLTLKAVRTQSKELPEAINQNEFDRIMRQAKQKGTARDVLMLKIFLNTGIRVSELKFFTVEALKDKFITAENKGKKRIVPIPLPLIKESKEYAKDKDIRKGSIILNRQGKPLSRSYIFKRLKWLGGQARVKKTKVYPHSIRHLFAKNYLEDNKDDILRLSDILGHSSLETTRIYTKLDTDELRKTIKYRG